MNIRLLPLSFIAILFNIFLPTHAVPIKVTRWRNAIGGSVLVFHDDHNRNEHLAIHNDAAQRAINSINVCNPIHFLIEDPTRDTHNEVCAALIKQVTSTVKDVPFIEAIGNFVEKKISENFKFYLHSVDSRTVLLFIYPTCYTICLTYPRPPRLEIIYQRIMADTFIQNISFYDLYLYNWKLILKYIDESMPVHEKIFKELKDQIKISIDKYKTNLAAFRIEENAKCIPTIVRWPMCIPPLFQEDDMLCQQIVEANCIKYLITHPLAENYAIFLGYEHAQNLERFLPQIEYVCCSELNAGPGETLDPDIYDKIFVKTDTCEECLSSGAGFKCSRCKIVSYCSQECQAKNWHQHKQICKKK